MTRLEELQAKEELNEEEQRELDELVTAAEADSDADVGDAKTDEEEFDEAFADALAEDDPDAVKGDDEDQDKDDKTKKKVSADADVASDDDEPKVEGVFVSPTDDAVKVDDTDDSQDDQKTDLELAQEENQKLTQKMRSWEGRITAANKRADEAEQKFQESKTDDSTQDKDTKKADLPDGEDDDKILKDFISEYPSLEKPIKAMALKIANQAVETKLKELQPKLEKIDQIDETLQTTGEAQHFALIDDAHENWREIRDSGKLKAWIDIQPSFVRESLENVLEKGTAAQVVEMFDSYKKSTGESVSSSTKKRSGKKTKKAQDMSAVDGSSGGPVKKKGQIEEDDFDGAWGDAISKD